MKIDKMDMKQSKMQSSEYVALVDADDELYRRLDSERGGQIRAFVWQKPRIQTNPMLLPKTEGLLSSLCQPLFPPSSQYQANRRPAIAPDIIVCPKWTTLSAIRPRYSVTHHPTMERSDMDH